jgi:glycosyltransferase involved in cell wall biosynthesis
MKVLLFAEYASFGGTKTYAKQLIQFYAKYFSEIVVVGFGLEEDEEIGFLCDSLGIFFRRDEVPLRSVMRLKNKLLTSAVEGIYFKSLILNSHPDLVVFSVGEPGLFFGCVRHCKQSIYILHTTPSPIRSRFFLLRWLRKISLRFAIPARCNYLVVSSFSKSKVVDLWGVSEKNSVSYIYNTAGASLGKQHFPSFSSVLCVLAVGHVVDYKNPIFWIDVALSVLKKNNRCCFVWVGDGPLLNECRSRVDALGLSENINFVGYQSDTSRFYRSASIYFHPSKVESLSISVLDAMRHGVPCVVSGEGGLPELFSDGESGVVIDLSRGVDFFSDSIANLLGDVERRSQLSDAAKKRYDREFSPKMWEERMLLYHKKHINLGPS